MVLRASVQSKLHPAAGAIQDLFAPGVGVAVTDPTLPRSAQYPEEAACLPPMRALRRREFLAGREALRQAISAVGRAPVAIPIQDDRAPDLPDGIRASLSHSATHCVAVADLSTRSAGLGIDIEPVEALDPALWDTVCTRNERKWLSEQPQDSRGVLAKQIFCIKEAVYKCQYALSRSLLDFDAFDVTFAPGSRFYATLRYEIEPFGTNDRIGGQITKTAGHFVAAARIPA